MKTKYLPHELTEKIEVNREQAAEILSDLKRCTAVFHNLHENDILSLMKEKSIFLYNHAFMAKNFEMALEMEESLFLLQKMVKELEIPSIKRSFQEIFQETAEILSRGKQRSENPTAYILGGQPGAGKSSMVRRISLELEGNIISINGDDFRKDHPQYFELLEKYGEEYVSHTASFSGKMVRELIDFAAKNKYHTIVEGTLRGKEVPLNTSKLFHQKGYRTVLQVLCVEPELSYQSTLSRYVEMKRRGMVARMTAKSHHDKVVAAILENVSQIYLSKEFDEIEIFRRDGEKIYSYRETPKLNPAKIMKAYF
ncbi:MAG TPA: zeta toxin family protein [Fusobacterium sp.]|uniref:zeta toxin family protein n=1 Tax=Fusobacterium sp. TaxID=68766 RepID=UPI002F3F1605